MRQVFYLVLTIIVLRLFFPDITGKLEGVLSAFLDLAGAIFARASLMAGA